MGGSANGLSRAQETEVIHADDVEWDVGTDILVAGGGGTGLVAALAAAEDPERTVTLLEKTDEVGGNTALSTGMIPAAGTRLQAAVGIDEQPVDMARDILEKNEYEADSEMVHHLAAESANLVHWLIDEWDITLHLVDDFRYPKHSEYRMHAPPGRNGETLVAELRDRLGDRPNVELLTNTPVNALVTDGEGVVGVVAGKRRAESIRTKKVILATDGFAGNTEMVSEWIDAEIEDALYFGADGNTGDGIRFGTELGAAMAYMDSYQAHATVAFQEGVLSTYAVIMNGGILVNGDGERFGDESAGYSEFAVDVLEQPEGVAYELFDERIFHKLQGEFDDFDEAVSLGAYTTASSIPDLGDELGFDGDVAREALGSYNESIERGEPDDVGREEGRHILESPFYGAKVTGSLFHTQGGLVVDEHARVLREDGTPVPNLYAGGGVAHGVSGHGAGGYLSGNGLTTALGFGRLAGIHARSSL